MSSVKKRESARVTAGTASIRKLERLGKLQQQLKEGGSWGARGPSLNRLELGWRGLLNLPALPRSIAVPGTLHTRLACQLLPSKLAEIATRSRLHSIIKHGEQDEIWFLIWM